MPRPTSTTTIGRPELGELVWEYALTASQRGFIGLEIMPIREVRLQSHVFPVIPIESLLKVQETARAPRANYNRGDWEFEMKDYMCRENGFEMPLDDVEAAMYDRYFDAEMVTTESCQDVLLRRQEKRISEIVQNPANAIATVSLGVPWSDLASCTPKQDIVTAKQNMRWTSGISPNTLVISEPVFERLLITKEIIDYLKNTNTHLLDGREANIRMLASYFDIERVLIGDSIIDQAPKNIEKDLTAIWTEQYAALVKVSTGGANLREPCFGRTFLWTEDSPSNINVESYRSEEVRSNIYRVRQNTDERVIFEGALYLLDGVTV